jgi:hypothetical protein
MDIVMILLSVALAIPSTLLVARYAEWISRRSPEQRSGGKAPSRSFARPSWQEIVSFFNYDRLYFSLFRRSVWNTASGAQLSEIKDSGLVFPPWLTGGSDPLRVRLDLDPDRGRWGTRIIVEGLGHGEQLAIHRRQDKTLALDEVATGHPFFDEEVCVQGRSALALALLDAETRWRVTELMQERWTVAGLEIEVHASLAGSKLVVWVPHRRFDTRAQMVEQLTAVLGQVLAVAHRLVAPTDLTDRIAENLREEPEVDVRIQSLKLLAREYAEDPVTGRALRTALGDPSEEVRLQAATALGEGGQRTLLALIENATHDSCAARAVAALGHRLAARQAEAALGRALDSGGRAETALACLEVLRESGRPESESLLLQALRTEDPQIAAAAARALGRAGTATAVGPLREVAETGHGELRAAARQAVPEIQARLSGAAPGQLSLAGSAAGALSLPEGEPGQLGLVDTGPIPEDDVPCGEEEPARPAAVQLEEAQ